VLAAAGHVRFRLGMSATRDRIAVTGALGFVASHLFPRLAARGAERIAIVRPGRDATRLADAGIEIRLSDLDAAEIPPQVFEGVGTVIHLSGMAQAVALTPALERARVARGVFVSSAGVHTRLVSPGADRKRAGEAAIRASSIAYTLLRPSMIYGTPADRNIVRLLRWLRAFPVLPVPGGGATPQQPVHVDDLVSAIVAALDRPESARREYDVGGPEAVPLRELIRLCGDALERKVYLVPLPVAPAHRVVAWLRRAHLPVPVSPEQILRLNESKAVDIGPARRDLGFDPRPLAEGIRSEVKDLPPR
jgi:uncharacterized protein YbjT (DUF2867 family)